MEIMFWVAQFWHYDVI